MKIDDCLSFHQLDDTLFLRYMSGAKAYATTAGFESVCEAMYLNKPVLMVPTHIEQACNAYDASLTGAGVVADCFASGRVIIHFGKSCGEFGLPALGETGGLAYSS